MRISDWSSDVCSSDLEWLTQVAPGIRIQVRREPGTKLQSELQDGRVDMALDFFKIRRQEFKAHHVMDETLVSMARLDHPGVRPEEGREGKECVSTCRSRRSPYH